MRKRKRKLSSSSSRFDFSRVVVLPRIELEKKRGRERTRSKRARTSIPTREGLFSYTERDDQRASARFKSKDETRVCLSSSFFFFRWKRCTLRSIDTNVLKAVLLLQEARLQKTIDNILFSHVRLIQTSFHDHSISAVESIPGLDVRARFVYAIDQQLDQLVVALLRRHD